jgi:hypothetical protein
MAMAWCILGLKWIMNSNLQNYEPFQSSNLIALIQFKLFTLCSCNKDALGWNYTKRVTEFGAAMRFSEHFRIK